MKKRIKFFTAVFSVIIMLASAIVSGSISSVETSASVTEKIPVPIIMYHSLLKDKALHNDYTISPTLFENDLKYLKENGYTTVTVTDLIDYVYNDKPLPDKCIMLSFDDGYYNNYYYAFPLLKKYECKAVISPIAAMTERFTETEDISVSYGHINVDNIIEMHNSGFVEIQNHSYDMHKLTPRRGVDKKKGESYREYKEIIENDILKAQKYLTDNTDITPQCFVYPFGEKCVDSEKIVKEIGFKCTLTCTEELSFITKSEESLYNLGRYRRDNSESMEALLTRINRECKQ